MWSLLIAIFSSRVAIIGQVLTTVFKGLVYIFLGKLMGLCIQFMPLGVSEQELERV